MKKFLSIILSVIVLVSAFSVLPITSFAVSVGTPSNVTITVSSATKVKVSWDKSKNAKKYNVYQSTKSNSGYKLVKSTTANNLTISKLKSGKTYYFKVRAVNGKSYSKYSAVVTNWGKINGLSTKEYEVIDYRTDGASVNSYAVLINFSKVGTAKGYQFKTYHDDSTHTESMGSNTTKLYYRHANEPQKINMRAYKTINGVKVYGPYKTIYNRSTIKISGDIMRSDYYDEYKSYVSGYKDIYKYMK